MTGEPSEVQRLNKRLDEVERRYRRLRTTVIGILVLAGAGLLLGQTIPSKKLKVVEANQFLLIDDEGKTRARLEIDDYSPRLAFADEAGVEQLELSIRGGAIGSAVALGGPELVIAQDVHKRLGPGVTLFPEGILLWQDRKKPSGVIRWDEEEDPEELSAEEDNYAAFAIGERGAGLIVGISSDKPPKLRLYDKDGKKTWSAP